jgi:gliding motility-associated-like protein
MKTKIIALLALLALTALTAQADYTPIAYYMENGEPTSTTSGIEAEDTLTVTFKIDEKGTDTDVIGYAWKIFKSGETAAILIRYGEETTYKFTASGDYTATLYTVREISTVNSDGSITKSDTTQAEGSITVKISNSFLEMPNVFSPNGDGINDIYKAKDGYKSIVDFRAYIFNRWGQKLYEWTDIDGGWDGTFRGKPVKAGVYFVLVKARGADGREYNIKRDVNLLRDYTESTSTE